MHRWTWLTGAALAGGLAASALLSACGSESAERAAFADADASDASVAPAIPEAGPLRDASTPAIPFDGSPGVVTCAVSPCVVGLVAGANHYCAELSAGGGVRCWGDPSPEGGSPVPVPTIAAVSDLAAAANETCAVSDGGVACWSAMNPVPTVLAAAAGSTRIFVGADGKTKCAIVGDGTLACAGDGALGSGTRSIDLKGQKPTEASLGKSIALVIDDRGAVFSWGNPRPVVDGLLSVPYLLGRPSSDIDLVPELVPGLPHVYQVATVDSHACALGVDGHLFCWGHGRSGLLGTGYLRDEFVATRVEFPDGAMPQQIGMASDHTCARTTDGHVYCWGGGNAAGQLGVLQTSGVYLPTRVDALLPAKIALVAVGEASSCALVTDGSVRCWGTNALGQLGRGTTDPDRHPNPASVSFGPK